MTVQTSIDNLLSTLKTVSVLAMNEAQVLIQQADAGLEALTPKDIPSAGFDITRPVVSYQRIPRPPTLPGLQALTLPTQGTLQPLTFFDDAFSQTAPTLTFPTFSYSALPTPTTFTDTAPAVPVQEILPTAPTLTTVDAPALTAPATLALTPVSGDPPDVPAFVSGTFTGDLHAEYLNGLAVMSGDLAAWAQWLDALRAVLLPAEQVLITRLQKVMQGTETGVQDTWELGRYQQVQQEILAERYAALTALDAAPSSVAGLSTGSRQAARFDLELKTLRATIEAAAKIGGAREDLEVKHLQWALELAIRMADAAMALKGQEAMWRMKGVMLALEGADATLDLAVKVLGLKEKELGYLTRYNEAQVRRTEDRLKIQLNLLEAMKFTVANNQVKMAYNDHQIQVYQLAASQVETRIKLFQTQIEYLATDVAWRKLAFQTFEANVNAYLAMTRGKLAEFDAIKARIRGDLALTEAELGKARLFEAQVAALVAEVQALADKAKLQAEQNKTLLQAYNTTVEAKLQELRYLDAETRLALETLSKGFVAEETEQELLLSKQDLADQIALHEAMRQLNYEQVNLLNQLKLYQIQIHQQAAEGNTISQGASVIGGIATQAFAGLNAVASEQIAET